ncbi:MAG: hypothetical protein ACRC3B_12380, partial [Bacteroidia bacterium]
PTVSWKLVSQKGTGKSGELNNYFHGFIIQWVMPPSEASVIYEMSAMDRYFLPATKTKADSPRTEYLTDLYTAGARPRFVEIIKPVAVALSALPIFGSDTVVRKVFRRNPKWKQMEIVCDVTGSMSPYSPQVMAWYKMNTDDKKVKRFVFFNDGDLKPDHTKTIGSTGGIYEITSSNFTDVYAKMKEAMNGGWGGDGPENNLEALLHVQNLNTDNQPGGELVMIADNWATPRDTSMICKLKRPVRIILCGAQYFINPAYLNIARATGGSLHLMEKDLEDLAQMREGEVLIIGSKKFTLRGGKFIPEGSLMPVQCCESDVRKAGTSVWAFTSMSVLMSYTFIHEEELSCT